MQFSVLLASIGDKIGQFFVGFFAFIPQFIYFLYASVASLLDVLQYLIRKLAGLDVYYVTNPDTGVKEAQTGDILTKFLRGILGIDGGQEYSALKTVFYSMIIFGCILLILCTIVAFIKAHYNYDANKANPGKIIGNAIKTLATMVIVPIVTIFGVYILNALLGAVDTITSPASETVLADVFPKSSLQELASGNSGGGDDGYKAYACFDYFSAGDFTNNASFSGMIFRVAAQSSNRVRTGYFTYDKGGTYTNVLETNQCGWYNFKVFTPNGLSGSPDEKQEKVAYQIDYAFANNLHLVNDKQTVVCNHSDDTALGTAYSFLSLTFAGGLINVKSFSKFNVALVYYFYDLWSFNWLLGFAGIIICAGMLGNIVFGLMVRLLQVVALFLVFPPLIGISPLDDGQGFASWRKQIVGDILMAVGAVVGTNIFFMILPMFDSISFFKDSFVNGIVNIVIIMAGLTLIKKFIGMISKFAGGSDANEIGQSTRADVTAAASKAFAPVMKGAGLGATMLKPLGGLISTGIRGAAKKAASSRPKRVEKAAEKAAKARKNGNNKKADRLDNKAQRLWNQGIQGYKSLKKAGFSEDDISKFRTKDKDGNDAFDEDALNVANRLNTLSSKARKAISQGKDGNMLDIDQLKYNVGLGGDDLTESGKKEKADSQKKWKETQESSIISKNKTGKLIAGLLGQGNQFKETKVVVDENTGDSHIEAGSAKFSGIGNALMDISEATFKTFAQISGASDAWKKLGDAGAVDAAKKGLMTVASSLGVDKNSSLITNDHYDLRTEKDKDKEEKKELKAARAAQFAQQQEIAKNFEDMTKSVNDLTKSLQQAKAVVDKKTEEEKKKSDDTLSGGTPSGTPGGTLGAPSGGAPGVPPGSK